VHCDVYRLEHLQDVIDLALPEMLDEGAVALVEWGDAVASTFSPDFLAVSISFGDEGDTVAPGDEAGTVASGDEAGTEASGEGDTERTLRLRPVGPSWSARFPELRKRLARWEWA
ncbi:MAG TPA: tRNA (adenosine(37)-N6)-threonylcarbamoyltransferase complex ATPase subunit type 1 TsaE, partial [Acidimicrobiales bacterium]|nr:tRNA (adenosine(37)-N6)-threonylcarbamoyltransferase complex ATPase subunit type 1 TsaE [Acidimicrobiales bacterium]